jgi:DnaK suppressor protein
MRKSTASTSSHGGPIAGKKGKVAKNRNRQSPSATSKAVDTAASRKGTGQKTAKKTSAVKKGAQRVGDPVDESTRVEFLEDPAQVPKTYLTDKDLERFRELLLAKRAELAGDVNGLATQALNSKGSGSGEHSAMPIHMADLGSDNWEQEFTLGLLESEEAIVREIDEALARIADRTYGMCLGTHKRISKARLRAKPWAKYCIEYARAREEGRLI